MFFVYVLLPPKCDYFQTLGFLNKNYQDGRTLDMKILSKSARGIWRASKYKCAKVIFRKTTIRIFVLACRRRKSWWVAWPPSLPPFFPTPPPTWCSWSWPAGRRPGVAKSLTRSGWCPARRWSQSMASLKSTKAGEAFLVHSPKLCLSVKNFWCLDERMVVLNTGCILCQQQS